MSRFEVIGRPRQRGLRRHPTFGRRGGRAPFKIAITGLSTDDLGPYGQIGTHAAIGFTVTDPQGNPLTPDSVKWSASPNPADAATFGAGANPTDFSAADGFFVYLHVTKDIVDNPDLGPLTVTRSFRVRRAPGAFAELVEQSFDSFTGAQTYVFAAATGAGLTWTYSLVSPPAGMTVDSATRTVTFDTDVIAAQIGAPFTVRAADQYGRTIDRTGVFTIVFIVANVSILSVGPQEPDGDFPISYTISRTETVQAVVYYDAEPTPAAEDFERGGLVYVSQGSLLLPVSGGPVTLDLVGIFAGSVRLAFLPAGGGDADVAVSPTFTLGGEAPPPPPPPPPGEWTFSGTSIVSSPTINPPTVSGTQITG